MSKLSQGDRVSSGASIVTDPLFFRSTTKEDWGYGQDTHKRVGFNHPQPLTWIKPLEGMARTIKAIVCCPNCQMPKLVDERVHKVDYTCEVKPSFHCQCGFHRRIFLDRWLKKPIYACAIEWILKDVDPKTGYHKIRKDIVYVSAETEAEARIQCGPGYYRFVAVGLAIAWFTRDKDGKEDTKLVGDASGFKHESTPPPKAYVPSNLSLVK
jgi:hypothetical protein